MEKLNHWTARSTSAFVFRISSDFVAQLQSKLEAEGTTHSELAKRIGVTLGRVSQVLNDPGNLTLKGTVRFARALGMKVAVVAYDDGDSINRKGPVSPEIFHACWNLAGAPRDFFELANSGGLMQQVGIGSPPVQGDINYHGRTEANRSHFHIDFSTYKAVGTASSAVN
jgi:transcriptional regulator with XRE-family HTH domain